MEKTCFRSKESRPTGIKTVLARLTIFFFLWMLPSLVLAGTFVSGLNYPTGIAISPIERSLFVNSGASGTVWKIPIVANGTAGPISVVTEQFEPPSHIVFDAAGNLYGLANKSGDSHLFILSTLGTVCSSKVSGYETQSFALAIEAPGLPTNQIFFNQSGYKDIRHAFLSYSNCTLSFSVFGGTCGVYRFLLHRSDRADLVASYDDKVAAVNMTNGTCTTLVSGLSNPNGIAEDTDGNLYIADTVAGKIIKRDTLGNTSDVISGLEGPTALLFDSVTGYLFVAETNAGRITTVKVDSAESGRINLKIKNTLNKWSKVSLAPILKSPNTPAACVDDAGDLYVFATKVDEKLYMNKRTPAGAWNFWKIVPGDKKTSSAPTAVCKQDNIFLYIHGYDDQVWEAIYKISTNSWGAWNVLTGLTTPDSPEVTIDADGNVYLLTRGIK